MTLGPTFCKVHVETGFRLHAFPLPRPFMSRSAINILILLTAEVLAGASPAVARPSAGERSPLYADSLYMPGEVFVITASELAQYNINTLEDILDLLPGVSYWMEGPPRSSSGFAVDGEEQGGATLLLDGTPFDDPYTDAPLSRFIPLSRLVRVEVIYGRSPCLAGRSSSGKVINFVTEQEGREGPYSIADFTYGSSNRRSRRIWFSTPRSYIQGSLVYEEYLQDPFEALTEEPTRLVGKYDSRSILMNLSLSTGQGDRIDVELHRFEDSYLGTAYRPYYRESQYAPEDVRYDGFVSRIRYSRGPFEAAIGQQLVESKRSVGAIEGHVTSVDLRWLGSAGKLAVTGYVGGDRVIFENRLQSIEFSPELSRIEGGIGAGTAAGRSFRWRLGLFGGYHEEAGGWIGGEAGLSRGREDGYYQRVSVSRREIVPSAGELFQPETAGTSDCTGIACAGNLSLVPARADELSVGGGFAGRFTNEFFARRESKISIPGGEDPVVYRSEGEADIVGLRSRITGTGLVYGAGYGYSLGAEYFASRSDYTQGVPEYRILARIYLNRPSFKGTEMLTLRLDAVETGRRDFCGVRLGRYMVLNFSASMTVMSAVVRFQYLNLLDTLYETVPGFSMDRRHFRIGVMWDFFD